MRARDRLSDSFLARTFAASARAGGWSRNEARRRQGEFVRHHWRALALIVGTAAALTPLLLVLPRWTRAFAAGAYAATVGWLLVDLVLLRSGAASLVMGEAGETWTAEELRRLRHRGWRVINRVVLGWGDIDHVALGPGGVVVIETKWAADGWSGDEAASRIDAAVRQLRRNRDRVRGFIRPELASAPMHSAVVLWGPEPSPVEPRVGVGDVHVLRGREVRRWLESLPKEEVDDRDIERVWKRIVNQTQRRDAAERRKYGPPPKGLYDYFELLWQLALGTLGGFTLAAWTLSRLDWKVYLLVAVLLAGFGLTMLRAPRMRPFAYAWICGSQFVTMLIVGAVLLDWVHSS